MERYVQDTFFMRMCQNLMLRSEIVSYDVDDGENESILKNF